VSGAGGNNNEKTTYVPLFRGIEPYLWAYSPPAILVYLWLLIRARFKGDEKGTVEFTIGDISDGTLDPSGKYLVGGVNLSRNTIMRALEELARGHLSNVPPGREAPPFIQITRKARGRTQKWKVEILKAKLSAKDFHRQMEAAEQKTENGKQEKLDFGAKRLLDELARGVSKKMDSSRVKTWK